jgi:lysophospholipase L1-like esterase
MEGKKVAEILLILCCDFFYCFTSRDKEEWGSYFEFSLTKANIRCEPKVSSRGSTKNTAQSYYRTVNLLQITPLYN